MTNTTAQTIQKPFEATSFQQIFYSGNEEQQYDVEIDNGHTCLKIKTYDLFCFAHVLDLLHNFGCTPFINHYCGFGESSNAEAMISVVMNKLSDEDFAAAQRALYGMKLSSNDFSSIVFEWQTFQC